MPIRYACREMGLNCTFVVKGETEEEVTRKALDHIREKHVNDFNIIQTPEQVKQMEKAIARSMRDVV